MSIPAQLPHPAVAVPPQALDAAVELLLAERVAHTPASRATSRQARTGHRRWLAERRQRARDRVVAYARAQKGDWYSYGASGPSRFDCSGLTQASMKRVGITLPHSAREQAGRGTRVTAKHAKPGDLVAYGSHVGMYVGRHRMVDAPGRGRRVLERAVYGSPSYRRLIPG